MLDHIKQIIKTKNLPIFENCGVSICKVHDQTKGFGLATELLYAAVDKKSVLYLSGGSTPKSLYAKLTSEELLVPGAVAMIDERFGPKFHPKSNEKMIHETDLLRYFEIRDIPFYPILQGDLSREETAGKYDEKLRVLQTLFQKHIGILGLGSDGHTAGIAPNRHDFTNQLFDKSRQGLYVSQFNDKTGIFKERITMTFLGLSMLDLNLILVFGREKKQALEKMFEKGSEEEVPGRFYCRPQIGPKTLIITDQEF